MATSCCRLRRARSTGCCAHAAERCGSDELAFLADASLQLPPATATDEVSVGRRHRDKEVLRALLAGLFERRPEAATALDAVTREIAETSGGTSTSCWSARTTG